MYFIGKGTSLGERYACQLSLIVVALGAVGFIAEVFNALEYIKGEQVKILRINCSNQIKELDLLLSDTMRWLPLVF